VHSVGCLRLLATKIVGAARLKFLYAHLGFVGAWTPALKKSTPALNNCAPHK
jgi:hypothetical protein